MGKAKDKTVVAASSSGIVVGSVGRLGKRKIAAVAGFAVVVVVVVGGGLLVWHLVSSRPKPNPDVTAALVSSQAAYDKGSFAVAVQALDGAAAKTNYKPQKAEVYDHLAVASASDGKLREALRYYDLKHQVDSGSIRKDANAMGLLYDRLGNTQKAIDQYTIALNYMKSLPNAVQLHMEIESLQGQIDALKGVGQ